MRCTNPRCSQHRHMTQTGFSRKQGCTHHCILCGWGYWTHKIKPTDEQIKEAKKINPKAVAHDLTYYTLKPIPPNKFMSGTVENMMIDYFGGSKCPYWLNDKLRAKWKVKYIKKYPSSRIAQEEAKRKEREEDPYGN